MPGKPDNLADMRTVWGIHNGREEVNPVQDKAVRIGWDELEDLSELDASREAFKKALAEARPDASAGTVPVWAGTLFRFVHKIQVGDLIVCPDRKSRTLRIGRVNGPYQYRAHYPVYRHTRPVEWLAVDVSRDELSLSAQNEISSLTTLFEITTGREEIEGFIDTPLAGNKESDISWVPFYEELADKILAYRHHRKDLISMLFRAAELSGVSHLFKYLRTDQGEDGAYRDITDIDPFTVFGPFNRGITLDARLKIAAAYREEFGVTAPAPTGFDGVPIVNNLNSWFIRFEKHRRPGEVNNLWDLADAAVTYAENPSEDAKEALVSAFDANAVGQTRQLTMGLFWIRPQHLASYDGTNATYIAAAYPDLAEMLTLKSKITGEEFLANTEAITSWIRHHDHPKSFPELSHDAYLSTQGNPEPPIAITKDTVDVSTIDLDDSYTFDSIVEDGSFLGSEELESILNTLARKKNLILQGPPGTGKTWLGRRLGWALSGRKTNTRVSVIQFHPSLSYEDFVRGWRPSSAGKLELTDGPFIQFCSQAADDPENNYVLVLEEINRGNPAQIFGEMLTLIENTKRNQDNALRLSYPKDEDETFHIPPNVHLIGTMNVADRSLALVDMALRRRFAFIDLTPQLGNPWVEHVSGRGYSRDVLEFFGEQIRDVNTMIAEDPSLGRHYCLGHSFFVPLQDLDAEDPDAATSQWLEEILATEIQPLLEEYWFDQPEKADEALALLRQKL
ncbi:AAA family ATPase [Corynebacterium sp. A21]|uniref:AAA family ATPase n=1 Tax=Corynebacterium sp. A21 TaxID=3457318 RepID=UPI003FD335D3